MKRDILLGLLAICIGMALGNLLHNKLDTGIPYVKANWEQIQLANNSSSHDPSWEELRVFLIDDWTQSIPYSDSSFICGDYAEMLHNNAEKAGIKTAVVIIHWVGNNVTHAINVFNTTDEGLAFIDDTGTKTTGKGKDKVAYINLGSDYGLIELSKATLPAYDSYVQYMATLPLGELYYPSMGVVEGIELFW